MPRSRKIVRKTSFPYATRIVLSFLDGEPRNKVHVKLKSERWQIKYIENCQKNLFLYIETKSLDKLTL